MTHFERIDVRDNSELALRCDWPEQLPGLVAKGRGDGSNGVASVVRSPESRPALALGLEWATKITVIGAEFVVPILTGFLIDKRLGSTPLMVLIGVSLGFSLGMYHSVRLASPTIENRSPGAGESADTNNNPRS
jgi:hypothetical protein